MQDVPSRSPEDRQAGALCRPTTERRVAGDGFLSVVGRKGRLGRTLWRLGGNGFNEVSQTLG